MNPCRFDRSCSLSLGKNLNVTHIHSHTYAPAVFSIMARHFAHPQAWPLQWIHSFTCHLPTEPVKVQSARTSTVWPPSACSPALEFHKVTLPPFSFPPTI